MVSLQQMLSADRHQRDQGRLQRLEDAPQRRGALASTAWTFRARLDRLHRHGDHRRHRRPGRLGRRRAHRRPDPLQQRAERTRRALHQLHAHLRRPVELDQGRAHAQVRRRSSAHPHVHGPPGRHHLHLLQPERAAEQHALRGAGDRRRQRSQPAARRRHRQPFPEAGRTTSATRRTSGRSAAT